MWKDTVETHREAVRSSILDAVHTQIRARGLAGITMSGIAHDAGIGRATLYKYFPDIQAILDAAHEQHVTAHLTELRDLAAIDRPVDERLTSTLARYLAICTERQRHGDTEVSTVLHRSDVVARAEADLLQLLTDLLHEAQQSGVVRDDTDGEQLARYCLHSLAGGDTQAEASLSPLLRLTLDGLAFAGDSLNIRGS